MKARIKNKVVQKNVDALARLTKSVDALVSLLARGKWYSTASWDDWTVEDAARVLQSVRTLSHSVCLLDRTTREVLDRSLSSYQNKIYEKFGQGEN